jgi:hypothetical protein
MPASLDLVWKPASASDAAPPVGKAKAIYRHDTYSHTIRITDGWLEDLQDFDYAAQLRPARLTGSTSGDPLAEFTVDLEQDGDDLLVTIGLASATTIGLPTSMFWDLQISDGGTDPVTTLLAGKAKCLDDVTRAVA